MSKKKTLTAEEEKFCLLVGSGKCCELEAVREVWPQYTPKTHYVKRSRLIQRQDILDRITVHAKKLFSIDPLKQIHDAWLTSTLTIMRDPMHKNYTSACSSYQTYIRHRLDRIENTVTADGDKTPQIIINVVKKEEVK